MLDWTQHDNGNTMNHTPGLDRRSQSNAKIPKQKSNADAIPRNNSNQMLTNAPFQAAFTSH